MWTEPIGNYIAIAALALLTACGTTPAAEKRYALTGLTIVKAEIPIKIDEKVWVFKVDWEDGKAGDVEVSVWHPVTGDKLFQYKSSRSQPEAVMAMLAQAKVEIAKVQGQLGAEVAEKLMQGITAAVLGPIMIPAAASILTPTVEP